MSARLCHVCHDAGIALIVGSGSAAALSGAIERVLAAAVCGLTLLVAGVCGRRRRKRRAAP